MQFTQLSAHTILQTAAPSLAATEFYKLVDFYGQGLAEEVAPVLMKNPAATSVTVTTLFAKVHLVAFSGQGVTALLPLT